jgi:hypothetical protein
VSRAWTWTSKSKSVWANGVSFQAINLNLSPSSTFLRQKSFFGEHSFDRQHCDQQDQAAADQEAGASRNG